MLTPVEVLGVAVLRVASDFVYADQDGLEALVEALVRTRLPLVLESVVANFAPTAVGRVYRRRVS